MPRKDGFPTNFEIAAEIEQVAHEVYSEAWRHTLATDIPPLYDEKPLRNIRLRITADVLDPENYGSPASTKKEELVMGAAERMEPEHPRWTKNPEGLEARNAAATRVGSILSSEIDLSQVHVGDIRTVYTAHANDPNRTVHTTSDHERPSKQRLIAAREFGSAALGFVQGPYFNLSPPERLRRIMTPGQSEEHVDQGRFRHAWELIPTSSMPINGREGMAFMEAHYRYLSQRIEQCHKFIDMPIMPTTLRERYSEELEAAEINMAIVERHLFGEF